MDIAGHGSMMGMGPGAMGSMMASDDPFAMMGSDPSGMPMDADDQGSMMGMDPEAMASITEMRPDEPDDGIGPVDEDAAVDEVDHQAHHPAASPEPTE